MVPFSDITDICELSKLRTALYCESSNCFHYIQYKYYFPSSFFHVSYKQYYEKIQVFIYVKAGRRNGFRGNIVSGEII